MSYPLLCSVTITPLAGSDVKMYGFIVCVASGITLERRDRLARIN